MKNLLLAFAVLLVTVSSAVAQDPAQLRGMFQAGQYQQVVEATAAADDPAVLYLAAQSHQRLGADGPARAAYGRLAARPESDPWHFIGASALALLDGQTDPALAAAQQATALAPELPDAHYQLGVVLARREEWPQAAAAFTRAAQLRPDDAYAHYYAGLTYSRANRADQMAIHFEEFLKLAPNAPERPEVVQIMRTVRGR